MFYILTNRKSLFVVDIEALEPQFGVDFDSFKLHLVPFWSNEALQNMELRIYLIRSDCELMDWNHVFES